PVGPYPVGVTNVVLTVSDGIATDTCTTTITVIDNTPPTANCAAPFTVQLDGNGNASITAADINNGSTDNCGIASTTIDITTFDCSNIGDNTVTLTVTDVNGNVSTCTTVVTVEDTMPPIAVCAAGVAVYVGSFQVNDGPYWGNNPPVYSGQEAAALLFGGVPSDYWISTNPNTTDPNTITRTAWHSAWGVSGCNEHPDTYSFDAGAPGYNDPGGNNTASSAFVNDNCLSGVNYVWRVNVITLELDANGQAVLDPALIDGGSTDNCGIANISVSPDTFTCADVGPNTVTLTVTDVNGNSSSCTSNIFVEDNIAPVAVCQNITVQLDAAGNATITAADVDGGSSDACGIADLSIDISTFDCSNVGANNVVLTVTDENGNISSCSAVVTVEDNVAPVANCAAPFTIQLDATGNASITLADIE